MVKKKKKLQAYFIEQYLMKKTYILVWSFLLDNNYPFIVGPTHFILFIKKFIVK